MTLFKVNRIMPVNRPFKTLQLLSKTFFNETHIFRNILEFRLFSEKKNYNLLKIYSYFFFKQLCIFFTPVNLSHYSVHKSIRVRLLKNEYFVRYFVICQNIGTFKP